MRCSSNCMSCLIGKEQDRIATETDEIRKARYMKAIMNVIATKDLSSPEYLAVFLELYREIFDKEEFSFKEIKSQYNSIMLKRESDLKRTICKASDTIRQALLFSCAGNYIDYGAVGKDVDERTLEGLLNQIHIDNWEEDRYRRFLNDLKQARHFVFLTDNCGEIVLDKLLIRQIQMRFSDVSVDVIVRGREIMNDATIEDAAQVGLTSVANVIGNGSNVAGTSMNAISQEARKVLERADVILAKGQGNYESLIGCGLNVYYLFLCKCEWFMKQFRVKKFSGIFISENEMAPAGLQNSEMLAQQSES